MDPLGVYCKFCSQHKVMSRQNGSGTWSNKPCTCLRVYLHNNLLPTISLLGNRLGLFPLCTKQIMK